MPATWNSPINIRISACPGLGFKRGLSENVVIAPYATALAAMVDPAAAMANFVRLAGIGGRGRYGFYEALDFTPSRLPEGQTLAIVRAYMAHHQGMTMVAIANALLDGVMRERFHAEPIIQATELLLQERTPRDVAVAHPRAEEVGVSASVDDLEGVVVRRLRNPHAANPSTHLLSNGRYSVMLTAAGSGYSRWGDRRRDALARGRDARRLGAATSSCAMSRAAPSGLRPTSPVEPGPTATTSCSPRIAPNSCGATASSPPPSMSSCRRRTTPRSGGCPSSMPAPWPREIELTSYAEIVLAPPAADAAHPAFSKLFVADRISARCRRCCWRHGDVAAPTSPRSGPRIWRSSKARRSANRRSRPTAPASSAAVTILLHRLRWSTAAASPTPSAPSSTRCSLCADACGFRLEAPRE